MYDLGEAECPGCGAPTTGWYQDGELIITRYCPTCRTIPEPENPEETTGDFVAKFISKHSVSS